MNRSDWERELLEALDHHGEALARGQRLEERRERLREQQNAASTDADLALRRAKTALDALEKLAVERYTTAPLGLEE